MVSDIIIIYRTLSAVLNLTLFTVVCYNCGVGYNTWHYNAVLQYKHYFISWIFSFDSIVTSLSTNIAILASSRSLASPAERHKVSIPLFTVLCSWPL